MIQKDSFLLQSTISIIIIIRYSTVTGINSNCIGKKRSWKVNSGSSTQSFMKPENPLVFTWACLGLGLTFHNMLVFFMVRCCLPPVKSPGWWATPCRLLKYIQGIIILLMWYTGPSSSTKITSTTTSSDLLESKIPHLNRLITIKAVYYIMNNIRGTTIKIHLWFGYSPRSYICVKDCISFEIWIHNKYNYNRKHCSDKYDYYQWRVVKYLCYCVSEYIWICLLEVRPTFIRWHDTSCNSFQHNIQKCNTSSFTKKRRNI
jgi:hypothetical protein